jgi:hypothetical protein
MPSRKSDVHSAKAGSHLPFVGPVSGKMDSRVRRHDTVNPGEDVSMNRNIGLHRLLKRVRRKGPCRAGFGV